MGCIQSIAAAAAAFVEPESNENIDSHQENIDHNKPTFASVYGGETHHQQQRYETPVYAKPYGGSGGTSSGKPSEKTKLEHANDVGLSPIYESLPSGAETQNVRNVYDGDTLTLIDERRVRFLGIDTPEIREKQAFAQEAKAYTKRICDKKQIYLTFEEGNREDHYGRLLAFVWVPVPSSEDPGDENHNSHHGNRFKSNKNTYRSNGYLNVSEGLVSEGLAFVYIVNQSSKPYNFDKLVALQKQARSAKRGIWSSFRDYEVFATKNGAAFHKRECKFLARSKLVDTLKASHATDQGLHPCRSCLADA